MVTSLWWLWQERQLSFSTVGFALSPESTSNTLLLLSRLSATVSFMGMFSCTSHIHLNEVKILFQSQNVKIIKDCCDYNIASFENTVSSLNQIIFLPWVNYLAWISAKPVQSGLCLPLLFVVFILKLLGHLLPTFLSNGKIGEYTL